MSGQPINIAIVGAGVTGLSIAYSLASRGAGGVMIFERTRIAAEASGVQPGGVRQQWGTEVNCKMSRESFLFYREMGERLESSLDPSFQSCGYVFVAETSAVLEQLEANVRLQRSLGIPSELLPPDRVAEAVPDIAEDFILGAAYCAEDGYFDNGQVAVQAFAEAAARHGVSIEYQEVVQVSEKGKLWKLNLADGSERFAQHVVLANGYDSPALARPLGIELPIETEARYLFLSDPISERLLEPLVVSAARQFAAKQLANGRILASDLSASGNPRDHQTEWRAHIQDHAAELLPRLQFVKYPVLVEGLYDMTPDSQPILGSLAGRVGLWIAAGFSGHGFMMAPVVGARIADAILLDRYSEELEILSFDRFSRGELVPEPQVF